MAVFGQEEEREAVVPQPKRRLAHAIDRAVRGAVVVLLLLAVVEKELKLVVVDMVLQYQRCGAPKRGVRYQNFGTLRWWWKRLLVVENKEVGGNNGCLFLYRQRWFLMLFILSGGRGTTSRRSLSTYY